MSDNEKLIDAAESMTADEIHQHPMAALDKMRALARELRAAEKAHTPTDDALRDAIDHVQGAVEFQDAINPEAVRVVIDAALRAAGVGAQGEPSDAQVQGALDAYHGVKAAPDWSGQRVEQMRAALRAAGGVR